MKKLIKKPESRKVVKKKEPKKELSTNVKDIQEHLLKMAEERSDIAILWLDSDFCLLIKKFQARVNKIINPNSFQPYEKTVSETFHGAIFLEWGDKEAKRSVFPGLIKLGLPVHRVSSNLHVDLVLIKSEVNNE